MKKLVVLLLLCLIGCGCSLTQGRVIPKAVDDVDWNKTSTYYHTFMDTLAPIGLAVASVADPGAADEISLARKELTNFDNLVTARAEHKSIKEQSSILYKAVKDANFKVGNNLFKLLK